MFIYIYLRKQKLKHKGVQVSEEYVQNKQNYFLYSSALFSLNSGHEMTEVAHAWLTMASYIETTSLWKCFYDSFAFSELILEGNVQNGVKLSW